MTIRTTDPKSLVVLLAVMACCSGVAACTADPEIEEDDRQYVLPAPDPRAYFSPSDLATRMGDRPTSLIVDNGGLSAVDERDLDAIANSLILYDYSAGLERIPFTAEVQQLDDLTSGRGLWRAQVLVKPQSPYVPGTWYAMALSELPAGVRWLTPKYNLVDGSVHLARFTIGPWPMVRSFLACPTEGGPTSLRLLMSEPVELDGTENLISVEVDGERCRWSAGPGSARLQSSDIHFLCDDAQPTSTFEVVVSDGVVTESLLPLRDLDGSGAPFRFSLSMADGMSWGDGCTRWRAY